MDAYQFVDGLMNNHRIKLIEERIKVLERERDEAQRELKVYRGIVGFTENEKDGELLRLRAAIEEAPHSPYCRSKLRSAPMPCDCWKRDALKGAGL